MDRSLPPDDMFRESAEDRTPPRPRRRLEWDADALGESAESEPVLDSHGFHGHDPDEIERCAAHGHGTHGSGTNGHSANGHGANGHGANGHGANGHGANGHGANGHGANGHGANGHGANGHGTNGYGPKSNGTNGHGAAGASAGSAHGLPGIPTDLRTAPPGAHGGVRPGPVCRICPLRSSCRNICEIIEEILPSMERGRVDAEDLPRLHAGIRMRRALLDWMHILTPHQQEVVRLYYRESLQQGEIAERLGVSQQAVHDSLRRARHAIGEQILHGGRGPRPGRPLDS